MLLIRGQLRAEIHLIEIQIQKLLRHLPAKLCSGLFAHTADLCTQPRKPFPAFGELFFPLFSAGLIVRELLEARLLLFQCLLHLRDGAVGCTLCIFILQMIDQIQTLLELRIFLRIEGKAGRVIRKAPGRIRKERIRVLQLQNGVIKCLINALHLDQRTQRPSHLLGGILLAALEEILGQLQCFVDASERGHHAHALLELLVLTGAKSGALDFRNLIGQKIRLPDSRRLVQLRILLAELFLLTVALPALLHLTKESGELFAGIGVHHLELRGMAQKALVLPLSVHIHEELRELTELFGRDGF